MTNVTRTDIQIAVDFGIKAFYGTGEDRCAPNPMPRAKAVACVRALRAAGYTAIAVQGPELFASWGVFCQEARS